MPTTSELEGCSVMVMETSTSLDESCVSDSAMAEQVSLHSSSLRTMERLRVLRNTASPVAFVVAGRADLPWPVTLEVTTNGSSSANTIFFVDRRLLMGANNRSKADLFC